MNLRDYLLVLRRRKWIGILVLVASIATAATLTTLATPVYEARATLFVAPQAIGTADAPGGAGGQIQTSLSIAERLTKTYARMIRSVTVADEAIDAGDLDVSSSYLLSRLTVTAIEDTTLIELRVRDPDPVRATSIANETAIAFVEIAEELTTASNAVDAQPIVPVELFERAQLPDEPVSPNASRNLALASVLGIVLGAGLMFAAEYLDVAVRGPEDVERLVELPVLALIPRVTREDLVPRRAPGRPRARASR